MAANLESHLIHRSGTVMIYDVCCRSHASGSGPEEETNTNCIVFPRRGVFLKKVRKTDIVADSNCVLFFRKHEPYRVAHPVGHGDDCTLFAYHPDLLTQAAAIYRPGIEETPDQPFEFTHSPNDQCMFLSCQRLRQNALCPEKDDLRLDELAVDLLAAVTKRAYERRNVLPAGQRALTGLAHRELVERTRLLLASRFAEDLKLGEIARFVYSSAFHLARLFRRETGIPIHQYRTRLRLQAALERIVAGEPDLSSLALDIGFSNHSHLSDLFRRAFGITPAECRRRATPRRFREMSKNLKAGSPGRA
jgi:AraC-like DNA-binding protein